MSRFIKLTKLVTATLAAGCILLGTAPAYAQTSSLPDPSRDGSASLTIHKFASSDGVGEAATGAPLAPEDEPSEPLQGANFNLYRVNLKGGNTDTIAGWQQISALQNLLGSNPTKTQLENAGQVTGVDFVAAASTGENGVVSFSNLPFGLYYVTEFPAPEGYFPIAPFLVTLPLTDTEQLATWIYDAHVYPKDRPGPTKEVIDGNVGAPGESVLWRISAPVPAGLVSGLELRDDLVPELKYNKVGQVSLMDYSDAIPTVIKVFQEGVDYHVQAKPNADGSNKVTVQFLPAGLAFLDGVNSVSQRIAADLDTTCLKPGFLENTAQVCDTQGTQNGRSSGEGAANPEGEICLMTNTVNTKWASLNIHKVDSKDRNKGLAGAEFELYYAHQNDFASAVATGQKVTTDKNGYGTMFPVRYSDWALGEQIDSSDPSYWYYWLVETKAPDGYILAKGSIPLLLEADGANSEGQFDVVVTNAVKPGGPGEPGKPGGPLAVTGATVTGFIVLAGVALFIGVGMKRRGRDKRSA